MQNSQIPISKQQPIPVSPYKDGRKDHDFVNPSLISHDVFYNLEYPKKDRNIPHCHKRQEITEKITNNLNNVRSLTPQPSKSIQNMGGNEMRSSYKKSPISQQNYNYRSNKEFFNRNDNKIIENNKNENNNDNKLFNNNEYNNRINGSTENFNQDNGYHENYNKNNYSQNDDIINDNKKNNNNYKNLNYKSHQNLHLEDYEEITPKIINSGFENTDSKTVNIKENYKIRNEINTTPNNKQDNDKINGVTPRKTQGT